MTGAIWQIFLFAAGIGLLVGGAWFLIGGGSRIAAVLRVPTVVVGLTVVAFGTSAPELFVSIVGAIKGNTGLVLGNVIGSNVANLGLILALAALLRPVIVERGLSRKEVPFLLVATVLFVGLVWDGRLGHWDAGLLVVFFIAFLWWTLKNRDRGAVVADVPAELPDVDREHRTRELTRGAGMTILGVGGLALGGHFIVTSALRLAVSMGVSETLIGLTLVAVGTSLPELATTIMAAMRNEDDLALGNIVGSNLFNILAVAGPVGLFRNLDAEGGRSSGFLSFSALQVQMICMLLLTFMVFSMIILGKGKIGRKRGMVLLLTYVVIMVVWATLN
ncbi:MAG: calcium/sodium antiporter [Candidatus Krumholzibacteria bacterium]|nr:calcium/sodium antiporter [Candidatus Krumholzibacteria bacterium]